MEKNIGALREFDDILRKRNSIICMKRLAIAHVEQDVFVDNLSGYYKSFLDGITTIEELCAYVEGIATALEACYKREEL